MSIYSDQRAYGDLISVDQLVKIYQSNPENALVGIGVWNSSYEAVAPSVRVIWMWCPHGRMARWVVSSVSGVVGPHIYFEQEGNEERREQDSEMDRWTTAEEWSHAPCAAPMIGSPHAVLERTVPWLNRSIDQETRVMDRAGTVAIPATAPLSS